MGCGCAERREAIKQFTRNAELKVSLIAKRTAAPVSQRLQAIRKKFKK